MRFRAHTPETSEIWRKPSMRRFVWFSVQYTDAQVSDATEFSVKLELLVWVEYIRILIVVRITKFGIFE